MRAGDTVLQVHNLHKTYGVATILDGVSFVLNDGERLGLIGPNGSGKSTLLRCLAGQEQPDLGTISLKPGNAVVGYLPQAFGAGEQRSIAEVLAPLAPDWQARMVLEGLGLSALDLHQSVEKLSGGQKTRLGLATLLLSEPDVLLLDEPTNHLDVDALEWLEDFINIDHYPRAVLVVSHDRVFLDATVSRVLYLDPETHSVQSYVGGYKDFAAARAHERSLQGEAWRRQEEYVQRVRGDIGRLKSEARSIEQSTTPRQPGIRRHARRKAAVAKSRERKLERYLASDERVEQPRQRWPINLDFGAPPPGGRVMLRLQDVGFWYPGHSPLFEHLNLEVRYGQRLGLIGPNGSGKTTLAQLISGDLQPTVGAVQLGAGVKLGVMAQEQETLDPGLSILETVRRERALSDQDARSFLAYFMFYGDGVFKSVGACSLGERSRLQLARLVLQGCNLLLLDEPINHLDVDSREHFEAALDAFEGTVIVVAHDRAFLRSFARRLLELRDGRAALT
jgi:ATPase subunit of ABC transporter with duplicated ATPase domains